MTGKRGEGVTVEGVGRATPLDKGPKPGTWWAMPHGERHAIVVRWFARRVAWVRVTV